MSCARELQVIVRKDGRIQLLCKGADTTVYERLGPESADMKELTTSNLNVRIYTLPLVEFIVSISVLHRTAGKLVGNW